MDWSVSLTQGSVTLEMTEEGQVRGDQGHWDGSKIWVAKVSNVGVFWCLEALRLKPNYTESKWKEISLPFNQSPLEYWARCRGQWWAFVCLVVWREAQNMVSEGKGGREIDSLTPEPLRKNQRHVQIFRLCLTATGNHQLGGRYLLTKNPLKFWALKKIPSKNLFRNLVLKQVISFLNK